MAVMQPVQNATAIQFAMEFYHIYLSHTVVLAFILGKKAI